MWLGNAVTSSTFTADPPSNETIDVFYNKNPFVARSYVEIHVIKFLFARS